MGLVKGRWHPKGKGRAGTIRPAAITEYLRRPLDDFDFMKLVPKEDLAAEAHGMGMRFATDPRHHQLVCWMLGVTMDNFYFILKQGGGKSKILLDIIRYRLRKKQISRALIIAPEDIHLASWEEQLREHAPDLTYTILDGSAARRQQAAKQKTNVHIINNMGLSIFMADEVKNNKTKKSHLVLNVDKAAAFASEYQLVGGDEWHRMVTGDSLFYECCRWLSVGALYFYALSGTPHGKDPTPLFHQLKVIDGGATLGTSLGLFHQTFFTGKPNYFSGRLEYKFNKAMTGELNRVIKNRSIVYTTDELYDVPTCIPIKMPVKFTGEAALYYARIIKGMIEAQGDYSSMKNVFVRMRQCASGYLSLKADDDSRIEVEFKDNPKLMALRDWLLSKPDEKILVYHEYRNTGAILERMMTEAKIGWSSLRGGTKNPKAAYAKFLEDKKCKVFILNNRTGSESINPQYVCRRVAFYESPTDPKTREQAERRVYRPGQEYMSFIHDFFVKGTIEEKILVNVKDGLDFMSSVLSGDTSKLLTEEQLNEYQIRPVGNRRRSAAPQNPAQKSLL